MKRKNFFQDYDISEIFKSILLTLKEAVVITDKDTKIVYANPAFETLYGYSLRELMHKPVNDVLNAGIQSPDFYTSFWSSLTETGQWRGEIVNKNKDNELVAVDQTIIALKDEHGNPNIFISYSRDISSFKKNELELLNSNKKFETTFMLASVGKAIVSPDGYILKANNSLCNMLGYTNEELLDKTFIDITHPDDLDKDINNVASLLMGDIISYKMEKRYIHKDGHIFWARLNVALIRDYDETPLYFISEVEDISDLKRYLHELETAKEQAEKSNQLKDAFISTISHEIKTPLNGIIGLSGLLKQTYSDVIKKDDEYIFESLEISTKRLIKTMDLILTMSRLKVKDYIIKPELFELGQMVSEIIAEYKTLAKSKGLKLEFFNYCKNTSMCLDKHSVSNAIQNIVDNAIKFTNKGGVSVVLNCTNGKYVLEFSDTGVGISGDYLKHIFEPYSQEEIGNARPYDGLGLGLSTAKLLLEQNGATLHIKSVKDVGTIVIMEFPNVV